MNKKLWVKEWSRICPKEATTYNNDDDGALKMWNEVKQLTAKMQQLYRVSNRQSNDSLSVMSLKAGFMPIAGLYFILSIHLRK